MGNFDQQMKDNRLRIARILIIFALIWCIINHIGTFIMIKETGEKNSDNSHIYSYYCTMIVLEIIIITFVGVLLFIKTYNNNNYYVNMFLDTISGICTVKSYVQ